MRFGCFIILCNTLSSLFSQSVWPYGFTKKDLEGSSIGIQIRDFKTDSVIYEYDADRVLVPASIQKILSTAAAMELLKPEYRFKTALGIASPNAKNSNKKFLVVFGSGDPSLGSRYNSESNLQVFKEWFNAIKRNGYPLTDIGLTVDASACDWKIPGEWIWNDIGNYYGVAPGAINYLDNYCTVYLKNNPTTPGNWVYKTEPDIPKSYIQIKSYLDADSSGEVLSAYGTPTDKIRHITGSVLPNQNDANLKVSLPYPADVLGYDFLNYLKYQGISISHHTSNYKSHSWSAVDTFYFHLSPPLKTLIQQTLLHSINLYAEAMVLKMGNGNYNRGVEILNAFWKNIIPNGTPPVLMDGSGLSRSNGVSAKFMCSALSYALKQPAYGSLFEQCLAVCGQPGGLQGFAAGSVLTNNLKGKSGYMSRVRSYTGVFQAQSGRKLVFCIMVNNSFAPNKRIKACIEQFLLHQYSIH